jgi:hypothetical protein
LCFENSDKSRQRQRLQCAHSPQQSHEEHMEHVDEPFPLHSVHSPLDVVVSEPAGVGMIRGLADELGVAVDSPPAVTKSIWRRGPVGSVCVSGFVTGDGSKIARGAAGGSVPSVPLGEAILAESVAGAASCRSRAVFQPPTARPTVDPFEFRDAGACAAQSFEIPARANAVNNSAVRMVTRPPFRLFRQSLAESSRTLDG